MQRSLFSCIYSSTVTQIESSKKYYKKFYMVSEQVWVFFFSLEFFLEEYFFFLLSNFQWTITVPIEPSSHNPEIELIEPNTTKYPSNPEIQTCHKQIQTMQHTHKQTHLSSSHIWNLPSPLQIPSLSIKTTLPFQRALCWMKRTSHSGPNSWRWGLGLVTKPGTSLATHRDQDPETRELNPGLLRTIAWKAG